MIGVVEAPAARVRLDEIGCPGDDRRFLETGPDEKSRHHLERGDCLRDAIKAQLQEPFSGVNEPQAATDPVRVRDRERHQCRVAALLRLALGARSRARVASA